MVGIFCRRQKIPTIRLFFNRLLLRIPHTLADFVFHRVFRVVKFADTATQAAHEFGNFIAAEQQKYNQKNDGQLAAAQVAKK